jgi:hypothetical protein
MHSVFKFINQKNFLWFGIGKSLSIGLEVKKNQQHWVKVKVSP